MSLQQLITVIAMLNELKLDVIHEVENLVELSKFGRFVKWESIVQKIWFIKYIESIYPHE